MYAHKISTQWILMCQPVLVLPPRHTTHPPLHILPPSFLFCSFCPFISLYFLDLTYISETLWHMLRYMTLFGASLSEPHTSETAMQDTCVCMSVCLRTWGHTLKFLIQRTNIYVHFKFAHMLKLFCAKLIWWICHYLTPLLNATANHDR